MPARRSYTREDVTTHPSGTGRGMIPAVNVKVHASLFDDGDTIARVARDNDVADWFTPEWIEAHHPCDDAVWNTLFTWACESGWDRMQEDAREIFGYLFPDDPPNERLKTYSLGRSGGWAYVEGLPDLDEWDAVLLAKWRKFAKWARAGADDIPYQMADLYLMNFAEEIHTRELKAARDQDICELYASRQELGV